VHEQLSPMSLNVLQEIFSKGFIKRNSPMSRHDDENVKEVCDCELDESRIFYLERANGGTISAKHYA